MNQSELKYVIKQAKTELEWYNRCIALLDEDDLGISPTNSRALKVFNSIQDTRKEVEKLITQLEEGLLHG